MKCTRCKWYKNKYINLATFDGNPNADIVFVGEAYGKSEVESYLETTEHKCFVGKAGFKFSELLKKANLRRYEVAVMNAMRCYQVGNPLPTKRDMDMCFIHTQRDLTKIQPKLVVAMGGSALYQTTGKEGITNYVGKMIWSDKINCNVYCTYHPASSMYDPDKWEVMLRDFERIPNLLTQNVTDIKHYDYTFIDEIEQFNSIYDLLLNAQWLGFDIETTGLDPINDKIVLLQLVLPDNTVYVIEGKIVYLIKEQLKNIFHKIRMTGQGFEFDVKFLYHQLGFMTKHFDFDTCLAEYTLTGFKNNDLTFLTGKYVPESFGYDDVIYAQGGFHLAVNMNQKKQYAADDVGVLPKIKRAQTRALLQNNQWDFFNNIIMPCNRVLTKMSCRGVMYDINAVNYADDKYNKLAKDCLNQVKTLDSVKACQEHFNKIFNPRSSQMIKWLILEYYQLPVLKETKKKKPSIGKVEMKRYAEEYDNEYCKIMELYRSYQNIRDNFLSGAQTHLYGNIAHTNYSLHATTTGRPNSKGPNLLNIPRGDKDIKRCYVARPGFVFVYGDESQVEVRVAAMLSQDEELKRICNTEGQDFHCAMTATINELKYDEVYHKYKSDDATIIELRNQAKAVTFGILYQMTEFGLAYRLGITVKQAIKFIDKYFEPFFKLKQWIDETKQYVLENGYVESFFGFRRYFPDYKSKDEQKIQSILREAVNCPVQSTAWNIMQLAMINVDKQLEDLNLKSGCSMQVYDSLAIETYKDEIEIVAPIMKNTMETVNKPYPLLNTVKLKTDLESGPNLADLKKYKFNT